MPEAVDPSDGDRSRSITERIRQSVDQSIQIIEKRVNALGTVEPLIQRQGLDRILVQVPGLQDPSRLKNLLARPRSSNSAWSTSSCRPTRRAQGRLPPEDEVLYSAQEPKTPYVVKKQVLVQGADLTDAQATFDQRTGEPVVSFKFNTVGLAQVRARRRWRMSASRLRSSSTTRCCRRL